MSAPQTASKYKSASREFINHYLEDPETLKSDFQEVFGLENMAKLLYAIGLIRGEHGLGEIIVTCINGEIKDVNSTVFLSR